MKRPCSGCDRRLPWTTEYFHRKSGDQLMTKCKECRRKQEQARYKRKPIDERKNELKVAENLARGRALTKLAHLYPRDFAELYSQERAGILRIKIVEGHID